jgi:hypothetical protein
VANKSGQRKRRDQAVSVSPAVSPDPSAPAGQAVPGNGAGHTGSAVRHDGNDVAQQQHNFPAPLQFIWDITGDWKRLTGLVILVFVVAFALVLISVGPAAIVYLATQHGPLAERIGIPSGSVVLTFVSALFGVRFRRRDDQGDE